MLTGFTGLRACDGTVVIAWPRSPTMEDSISDLLTTCLREGASHPALALARLYLCLRENHPVLERAVHAATADQASHAGRVNALKRHLGRATAIAEVVEEADCLALLQALDTFAADQFAGQEPAVVLVKSSGVEAWVQRRPTFANPVFSRQPNQLQFWMVRHWVFPTRHHGIEIHVRSADDSVSFGAGLVDALTSGELRVHLGGFDDRVAPQWNTLRPRYGCVTLSDEEARWASIIAVVEAAVAAGAHVLVLPELTVTPTLRERISRWLARHPEHPFQIVVPGSFHQKVDGVRRNVAVAFDRFGDEILVQRKLRPMRVAEGGTDVPKGVIEDVEGDSRIELTTTPLGLLALGICLDFCEEGGAFADLWHQIGPGLVLVASMSGKTTHDAHQRRAKSLHLAHSTISAVAIQPDVLPASPSHVWGLLHPEGEVQATSPPAAVSPAAQTHYVAMPDKHKHL